MAEELPELCFGRPEDISMNASPTMVSCEARNSYNPVRGFRCPSDL